MLPCVPATFPSTWHKTCQKKNLPCSLSLHLGLIPLPSPCLYSTREIQCNSTQQATLSSHQVTGRMPGASSTKKNKALFSGVLASGKERKRKQTMTYQVIITIERDTKHRKSKSHSVERDQGRQSRALPGRNKHVQRCRSLRVWPPGDSSHGRS